jgi:hypothetical protein
MKDGRINAGRLIVILAAVLLLASLFVDWYSADEGVGVSGWNAFELADIVLAGTALLALWLSLPFGGDAALRRPKGLRAVVLVLAVFAVALVAANMLSKPPLARDLDLAVGALLALLAAVGLLAGLLLETTRLSLVIEPRRGGGPGTPPAPSAAGEPTEEPAVAPSPATPAEGSRERAEGEPEGGGNEPTRVLPEERS